MTKTIEKKLEVWALILAWIIVISEIVCVAYCFRCTTFLGTISAMFLLAKTWEDYRSVKLINAEVTKTRLKELEELSKKEVKSDNVVTFGFDMRG